MNRALAALFLVACAGAPMRAPTTARAAAVATPPPALEVSFHPSRIFAGQEPNDEHTQGTLVMVSEHRLDELDIATMNVFRSLDFERDDFAAFAERGRALYVVTVHVSDKLGPSHTLHRVDLASLKIVQSATTMGDVPLLHDRAFPSVVSVGTRGVRVTFLGSCPSSVADDAGEDGCVQYETHRLDDLAVTTTRAVPLLRIASAHVPDDFGELQPEPKRDVSSRCRTQGIFFVDRVWVGDDYFELRFGCCGSPRGGLFRCKPN